MGRLVAAELEIERLRGLLRDVTATHRLTNRYAEALLLVPQELWFEVCQAAGVEPTLVPGGGPNSAVGEAAEQPAAGDGPPTHAGES